jgi:hypothetical protein
MSETQEECGVPIHSSIGSQVTIFGLMAVHKNLVGGL